MYVFKTSSSTWFHAFWGAKLHFRVLPSGRLHATLRRWFEVCSHIIMSYDKIMFVEVGKLVYVVSLVFMLKTATKCEHLKLHFCFRLIYSNIRSLAFGLFSPARISELQSCHKVTQRWWFRLVIWLCFDRNCQPSDTLLYLNQWKDFQVLSIHRHSVPYNFRNELYPYLAGHCPLSHE